MAQAPVLAMATAVVSALSERPVRHEAMTGERDHLAGAGASHRRPEGKNHGGLPPRHQTVIIPAENQPDLKEVDEKVKSNIQFVPVETLDTVLEWALGSPKEEEEALSAGEQTKEAAVVPPVKKDWRKSRFFLEKFSRLAKTRK